MSAVRYEAYEHAGAINWMDGRGRKAWRWWNLALLEQQRMRSDSELVRNVQNSIKKACGLEHDKFVPLLPPRWSNQIGHIGFIDGYLKIQQLQGIETRPLLFGESRRIANAYYLSLWRRHIDVATEHRQLSELLPYASAFQ